MELSVINAGELHLLELAILLFGLSIIIWGQMRK